jgi:hypothetical protein
LEKTPTKAEKEQPNSCPLSFGEGWGEAILEKTPTKAKF